MKLRRHFEEIALTTGLLVVSGCADRTANQACQSDEVGDEAACCPGERPNYLNIVDDSNKLEMEKPELCLAVKEHISEVVCYTDRDWNQIVEVYAEVTENEQGDSVYWSNLYQTSETGGDEFECVFSSYVDLAGKTRNDFTCFLWNEENGFYIDFWQSENRDWPYYTAIGMDVYDEKTEEWPFLMLEKDTQGDDYLAPDVPYAWLDGSSDNSESKFSECEGVISPQDWEDLSSQMVEVAKRVNGLN